MSVATKRNTLHLVNPEQDSSNQAVRSRIIGTGSALPSIRVDNSELAEFLDTNDDWITSRVGISSRYVCAPHESTVSLAAQACSNALDQAGCRAEDIDLVIVATVTPDKQLPSAAALLAKELGVNNSLAFDMQAACSGFLFALATADSLLASLGLERALIVGAESLSRIIDWSDRNTAVLFGDGAGACVLHRPSESVGSALRSTHLRTHAQGADLIRRPGCPFPPATFPAHKGKDDRSGSPYVEIQGREVFKSGCQFMVESIQAVLSDANLRIDDVALFIPHQSNLRMIKSVCTAIGRTESTKIVTNIERIGNTSAASIPIALDEAVRTGMVSSGDILLLTAVGSGMTYGSVLLQW